jgi:hypothetical protein
MSKKKPTTETPREPQQTPRESTAPPAMPPACCRYCRHWVDRDAVAMYIGGPAGECRRYPPTITTSGGPMLGGRGVYVGTWPLTCDADHCGEFAALVTKPVT